MSIRRKGALPWLIPSIACAAQTQSERPRRARLGAPLIGLCGACAALGYATSQEPLAAGVLVAAFLAAVAFVVAGLARFTAIVLATLPWLVMLDTLIPKLTLTFTSAAGALLLLSLTRPRFEPQSLAWVGTSLFLVALLLECAREYNGGPVHRGSQVPGVSGDGPCGANRAGRQRLVGMRSTLLYSGVGAMAAQGAIVLLHLGRADTKYGAGEQLGFATQNPHELGLVGAMVAVACTSAFADIRWRLIRAAIAVMPALATGVRSALRSSRRYRTAGASDSCPVSPKRRGGYRGALRRDHLQRRRGSHLYAL